jgi:hypothetical protein
MVPTQSSQDKEKLSCPFQCTDNFPEWKLAFTRNGISVPLNFLSRHVRPPFPVTIPHWSRANGPLVTHPVTSSPFPPRPQGCALHISSVDVLQGERCDKLQSQYGRVTLRSTLKFKGHDVTRGNQFAAISDTEPCYLKSSLKEIDLMHNDVTRLDAHEGCWS